MKLRLAGYNPGTPETDAVVAVVNHIPWAAARAGSSAHVGRLMGRAKRPT